MQQVASKDLKNRFGAVMKEAQKGAVEITRRGEPVAILLSTELFESMGGNRARFRVLVKEMQAEANANGLDDEALLAILNEKD